MSEFQKDVMGWLRLVGSLKLPVSFAEYSLSYRALLQKRPTILTTYRGTLQDVCVWLWGDYE